MFRKRHAEGAHRSDGQGTAPGHLREPKRWTAREEAERQAEADQITEGLGGWPLVMWSPRCRAFLAFGWWGYPPLVGVDRGEIEREISGANARMRPGGR